MKKFILSAALALTAIVGSSARADFPSPFSVTPASVTPAATQAGRQWTDSDVSNWLKSAGLAEKIVDSNGINYHVIQPSLNGRTYNVGVMISPSKNFVYFVAFLGPTLPSASSLDGDSLLKLLKQNDAVAPAALVYDAANNQIKLQMPLLNKGLTHETLSTFLNTYVSHMESSMPIVADAVQKPAASAPAPVVYQGL